MEQLLLKSHNFLLQLQQKAFKIFFFTFSLLNLIYMHKPNGGLSL